MGTHLSRLHLDFETFSTCDLKRHGAYRYAEHPSTEILVACYAFDDEEVQTWIPGRDGPVPQRLREHIEAGGKVCAHNYSFEMVIANGVAGAKIGFPKLTIEQGICTAAKARSHGLPGGLGDVAKALGSHAKSDAGRGVMMQVCRPKKPSKTDPSVRYTWENAPDKFAMLLAYCQDDVRAERGVDRVVPDLVESEREIWELDQRINGVGVRIDLEAVANIQFLIEEYRKELHQKCIDLTWDFEKGEGIEPTKRARIADWVRVNGWPYLQDMQAETIRGLLVNEKVPKNVREVLRLYSTYGMKAVSKFETMVDVACADGRVRGLFIFAGAGPGRWSSVLLQLQNVFRGAIEDPDVAIEACAMRDLQWVKQLYPHISPMLVFASCVRGMLIADPGKKLVSLDFSGIESRVGAWLAGEGWKLQAFREMDAGTGPDTYKLAYARSFRVPVESVDKKKRQIGKVEELSLLYEGGVGAFTTMTRTYSVKLDELTEAVWPIIPDDVREKAGRLADKGGTRGLERRVFIAIDSVKRMWRDAHPAVVQLWRDLKEAAYYAVSNPGSVYSIPSKKIMFCVRDRWLYMKLPSGRKIAYFEPQVDEEGVVSYMGIDTDSRRWMRVSTYGGKILENSDQGFSSCLLRNAMRNIDGAGFSIIMTIHDEIVVEVDENADVLEQLRGLMCAQPKYTAGLPLAAEGWAARRFKK